MKDIPGFIYLALGDPMQKRNYYRAGWIKFAEDADMTNVLSTLGEKKVRILFESLSWTKEVLTDCGQIEGFKLHLTHSMRPFVNKVRMAPEVASKPDRIAKDLTNARRLVGLLEEEYERVRTFKPSSVVFPPVSAGTEDEPRNETRDISMLEAPGADEDDEEPNEKGSVAIERRLLKLASDYPEPSSEGETRALENKKVCSFRHSICS